MVDHSPKILASHKEATTRYASATVASRFHDVTGTDYQTIDREKEGSPTVPQLVSF